MMTFLPSLNKNLRTWQLNKIACRFYFPVQTKNERLYILMSAIITGINKTPRDKMY
jgi:hypothetical protein